MRTAVIILAAGQGKRFGSPLPKVLAQVGGKPMAAWVVKAVRQSGVTDRPVVVIGAGGEAVRTALGDGCDYVDQDQQLGTGHAVAQCRKSLEGKADAVLVLYGDQPLVRGSTIRTLVNAHERERPNITMMTIKVPDFDDWRRPFASFGRIQRDRSGNLQGIVEVKDAQPQDLKITELNPAYFCFDGAWLWPQLEKLSNRNAQGEYYLTDLVGMAIQEGKKVETVNIPNPEVALGANSPEDLKQLESEMSGWFL